MMDAQALAVAQQAAQQAAARFTERGEEIEAAVSRLMADRYTQQLTEMER